MHAIKNGSREHQANTRKAIADRKPFKTGGALRGQTDNPGVGLLPIPAREVFYETVNDTVYFVISWDTPIAWYVIPDPGEAPYWVFVDYRYSSSSSSHQRAFREAVSETSTTILMVTP